MAGEIKQRGEIVVRLGTKEIDQLIADLKVAEGRTPKEVQVANKNCADIAVRRAKALAPKGQHQGGGRVQPLASAIVSQATTRKAYIAFGGSRAPHGAVTNFGGTIPRYHSATRTKVRRQEHIYEAIAQTTNERTQEYEQAVDRITQSLKPTV